MNGATEGDGEDRDGGKKKEKHSRAASASCTHMDIQKVPVFFCLN